MTVLFHCADLHLDSVMDSRLPEQSAAQRRRELLQNFSELVSHADAAGAAGILIAGDLFDTDTPSPGAVRFVTETIAAHPHMSFCMLRGNHDRAMVFRDLPENLLFFPEHAYGCHTVGEVQVWGCEDTTAPLPQLSPDRYNILMLHGQITDGTRGKELIPLRDFANRNIDYLALGHLHAYRQIQVDDRCICAYSGALEGRGFDEPGDHGYVHLEFSGGKCAVHFVPCAKRRLHTVSADLTDCRTHTDVQQAVQKALAGYAAEDLIKVQLCGRVPVDTPIDIPHLSTCFSPRFFFLTFENCTKPLLNTEDYRYDISLKGEFIRTVLDAGLPEELRDRVLLCGLQALAGEEITE